MQNPSPPSCSPEPWLKDRSDLGGGRLGRVWAEEEAGKGLLPLPAPSRALSEGNLPNDAVTDREGLALMAY